jgi:hypothetical protein
VIHGVRIQKRRPRWLCRHRWTIVGKESRYLKPGEVAYVFERCWRCMTDRPVLIDGDADAR